MNRRHPRDIAGPPLPRTLERSTLKARRRPADGDTRPCPQCRSTLVFSSRYPVLTVGMALVSDPPAPERIRYAPAWVCRNGGCDFREFVGDA
jgi:hypothetical protein